MATHCSILAWEIPWTEELGGPRSMGGHKESEMTERLKQQTVKQKDAEGQTENIFEKMMVTLFLITQDIPPSQSLITQDIPPSQPPIFRAATPS